MRILSKTMTMKSGGRGPEPQLEHQAMEQEQPLEHQAMRQKPQNSGLSMSFGCLLDKSLAMSNGSERDCVERR